MTVVGRLELFHVAVPLEAPFHPSWIPGYPQTECRFTLLKMTTKERIEGRRRPLRSMRCRPIPAWKLLYAAQGCPQSAAEIADKRRFRTGTSLNSTRAT